MSAVQSARSGPSLLPGATTLSPGLVLGVIVLSFIAAFELTEATAVLRAAVAWSPRMAGTVTVAVSGGGLERAEAAAARASEVLARAPGVTRTRLLDPDPGDAAAARLMGLDAAASGGGPPRLIAATLTDRERTSAAALAEALRRQNVAAAIDDHGLWTGPLERAAVVAVAAAGGSLIVLMALTWALAAASAGGTVRQSSRRVSLLLHLGATDRMVLGPVRAGTVGAVALGALIGAGGAAVVGAAAIWSPAFAEGIDEMVAAWVGAAPRLDPWDLAVTALWPLIAALIAAGAAAGAARARLRALA